MVGQAPDRTAEHRTTRHQDVVHQHRATQSVILSPHTSPKAKNSTLHAPFIVFTTASYKDAEIECHTPPHSTALHRTVECANNPNSP